MPAQVMVLGCAIESLAKTAPQLRNFVTSQFRWMLETVIFVYVVLYPWCVRGPGAMVSSSCSPEGP